MAACFNPRAPHGARRYAEVIGPYTLEFQSTRPARGATQGARRGQAWNNVSIHAPRTGRDGVLRTVCEVIYVVSIHAPRTGRDCGSRIVSLQPLEFQSTRPARGATRHLLSHTPSATVSIHAPRTGRDWILRVISIDPKAVSIHAPRTGRDHKLINYIVYTLFCFNPRAPHGARQSIVVILKHNISFQSTRPARGATWG